MLICGTIISAFLFSWVYRQEQRVAQGEFDGRAQFRLTILDRGLDGAIEALKVVNQFFIANGGNVSQKQFHSFTEPLLASHPYIHRFLFTRVVSQQDRSRFEQQMRIDYPGFTISDLVDGERQPARLSEQYYVINFLEPYSARLLGVNALSQQAMNDAITRAEDTGSPAVSTLFPLASLLGKPLGFRVLMPVYQGGVVPGDVASRRQAVVGDTVAVLRADEVVQEILASATGSTGNADLDIRVYASDKTDDSQLAYRSPVPSSANRAWWQPAWSLHERAKPFSRTFDVAGSTWRLDVAARPSPFLETHGDALTTLLLSLLTTLVATAYLQSAAKRRKRILQLVDQRTDELKQVNIRLRQDNQARQKAEEALSLSRSELRNLANHMNQVKEDERKRIARDIHDELGQNLLALRIDVSLIDKGIEKCDMVKERAAAIINQLDDTVCAVRAIINDLRPAVLDLGLAAALEWQALEFTRRTGIACALQMAHKECELDDARTTALFRAVQEALTNIMRHANATRVEIQLQNLGDTVELKIEDNGIGFAPECRRKSNSFGLIGIEERIHMLGGHCAIDSKIGRGTTMLFSIPVAL